MTTVLVVEDSADQADLLRANFERSGCTVTLVSTGEDALASCAEARPDIMVIDLVLPGMQGSELTSLVRERYPQTAIVITSVLDTARFPIADGVLPKPFTKAHVRRVLGELQLTGAAP